MKTLLTRGPNFRDRAPTDVQLALEEVLLKFPNMTAGWLRHEGLKEDSEALDKWQEAFIALLHKEVEKCKKKDYKIVTSLLKDQTTAKALKNYQEYFVFTEMDKANSNFAIVCKGFYQFRIAEQVFEDDSAYTICEEKAPQIVEKLVKDMAVLFDIVVAEEQQKLASAYWTAKMHKSPAAARFIAAMHACVTKELARIANLGLTTLLSFWKGHCQKEKRKTGIRHYWIAKNADEVKESLIHEVNMKETVRDTTTLDFSTLYTKLPQAPMKAELKEFVNRAFEFAYASDAGEDGSFLEIGKRSTSWKKKHSRKSKQKFFKKQTFLMLLIFQLDNIYVQIGDMVLRQTTGIPMGVDDGPNFANIFLFMCEYKWIKKMLAGSEAEKQVLFDFFRYIARFIDDLIGINNAKFLNMLMKSTLKN